MICNISIDYLNPLGIDQTVRLNVFSDNYATA